jgi:hypothetical protein
MFIQRLEGFIPCIQCIPQNSEQEECRVFGLGEYILPVDTLPHKKHKPVERFRRWKFRPGVVVDNGACFHVADHMDCEKVDQELFVIYERSHSVNIRTSMHIPHILRGSWVSIWLSAVGCDQPDRDAAWSDGEVRTNGKVIVMSVAQVSMRPK